MYVDLFAVLALQGKRATVDADEHVHTVVDGPGNTWSIGVAAVRKH